MEPWFGREQLAWTLIGLGLMIWTIAEGFLNYYLAIGQNPAISMADIGFSIFPILVFVGLILQPSSKNTQKRVFLLLDSLIVTGALLSIAWFLLLGPLAETTGQTPLVKFLNLYYPFTDIAMLSCLVFLLLRGTGNVQLAPARRISLLLLGIGLCVFTISDFLLNVLSNDGLDTIGSLVAPGWSLGLMTMGVGAYVRRFLPSTTKGMPLRDAQKAASRSFALGQHSFCPISY
jgi:hypothetical protein